jgi:hypothetical protein
MHLLRALYGLYRFHCIVLAAYWHLCCKLLQSVASNLAKFDVPRPAGFIMRGYQ